MEIKDLLNEVEYDWGSSGSNTTVTSNGTDVTDIALGVGSGLVGAKAVGGLVPGRKNIPKGTKAPTGSTKPVGTKAPNGSTTPANKQSTLQRLKRRVTLSPKLERILEKRYDRKYGFWPRTLFRVLGLTAPILQTMAAINESEQAQQEGLITPQELETLKDFHYGVLMTQYVAMAAARIATSSIRALFLGRIVKNIAAVISAPATAGLSVAAAVASEAFIAWATWWLGSDEGRKWLSESFLMPYIIHGGDFTSDVGKNALDGLMAIFSNSEEAKKLNAESQ